MVIPIVVGGLIVAIIIALVIVKSRAAGKGASTPRGSSDTSSTTIQE